MPIFCRLSAQISIMQVKVDGLERSKQHRNMHKLSTFNAAISSSLRFCLASKLSEALTQASCLAFCASFAEAKTPAVSSLEVSDSSREAFSDLISWSSCSRYSSRSLISVFYFF